MKNKIWLLQIPFIVLFTFAFYLTEAGSEGELRNPFLIETVYPTLRNISAFFTDIKFKIRGVEKPKNKIVIVEIDSPSIEAVGRWPWHRDATAALIQKAFDSGAKVVGLDIMFSEKDQRIPEELAQLLQADQKGALLDRFETDKQLTNVILANRDNLVLGYTSEGPCNPAFQPFDRCPVTAPEALESLPKNTEKFAFAKFSPPPQGFDPLKTPVMTMATAIANAEDFNSFARHAGYFNVFPDSDSHIRKTSLLMFANKVPYPSLALEMARVGLGEELQVTLDANHTVSRLGFLHSGKALPVNQMGVMEINFRGPSRTFTYVSALDLLNHSEKLVDEQNRKLAGLSAKDILKDAYVLIGVSALGAFDMRAFPFDSNTPGVEGHAYILDNLLSNDGFIPSSQAGTNLLTFFLMTVGALALAYLTQKLQSVQAMLLFVGVIAVFGTFDSQYLFRHHYDWNAGFFYLETATVFVFIMMAKYILEEQNKKFIRSAFTKYVSPAVVDSILEDPTKLSLGGERRDLTILFSDIRGFTTFSEQMDAKQLAAFLNDYLGIMTKIVFAHQGTLDKYIGDAVMAFWGAPLNQPDHAANACNAAIAMQKALDENRERFKTQYNVHVEAGVGLNTGAVSVGNMGTDTNFEYTVIGDHVNLASRLEGLTKAYGVKALTSRFTLDNLEKSGKTAPDYRVIDHVKVKGKKNAVELIQLLAEPLSPDVRKLFSEGRELYTQQKWDLALEKFQAVLALYPTDGPSQVFTERCRDFKITPPEAGWDGSWEMHSK